MLSMHFFYFDAFKFDLHLGLVIHLSYSPDITEESLIKDLINNMVAQS